ncbi:hypothetical protein [Spirosoma luteum]|uniref:hypothetical protein n=1 Tax=Spirosoma luteum TaxID=431553 RepID=UPI0012FA16E8|nr:hypothetical protein [Spirosoma luteum]
MRKINVLLLVITSLMVVELPLETMASSPTTSSEMSIFKRKRKGYKAKRGGLFNTGLFRKKNACGCPKH